jgi:5-methylcytosine-specific restriction protein A
LTARTFKGGHTKNRTGIPRTVAYGLRRNGRAIPAGPPYRCNWGIFLATRVFRTDRSIFAEEATRGRVQALLERHGITVTGHRQDKRGSAIIQVIEGHIGDGPPMRMHVRLCWRRDGRNAREALYSAAQLKARRDKDGWEQTLAGVAARHRREGHTHSLMVQDSEAGFVFAVLVPCDDIPMIWERQRAVSADLLERGLAGNLSANHAANGSSPSLWLQDDRYPDTPAVARVIWDWPGVINVMALALVGPDQRETDTLDDLPVSPADLGRDGGEPRLQVIRSGYPRDARVREAVARRAGGRCERASCTEARDYPGFLDVHHILGIDVSDRVWTCVALCPNCHREAHFSPDRDAINAQLRDFAAQFA